MTATVLCDVARQYEVTMPGCAGWDDPIPLVTGPACQGDVSILPVTTKPVTDRIPDGGVVIATGDSGHPHTLHGDGFYQPARPGSGLTVGHVTVPEGGAVFLLHAGPHGGVQLAPGTYRLGCQREWAGEWRRVAD